MTLRNIRDFLFGTLRGRLILGVAAVHAVMMTLFIIDLTVRQRSMLLDNQAMQAVAMSQSLAISAAGWIAADDISGLQELVETERRYPEMLFAILTDDNGQVLAHSDKSKRGLYLRGLPSEPGLTVVSKSAELVDVAVPAMLGDHFVGWARIGIGQKAASNKLSQITTMGVMYALAAIAIGALLAWSMGRRITRRLYTVQETINRVRAGNRQARSVLSGCDEAAMMAQEFNSMLDAVARRDAELQASEEKYRSLIEKIQAAVIVHGADTRILMSNHLAQELLGISEAHMAGKSAIDPDWHFYREDGSLMPLEDYPVNRVLATRERLRNYVIGRRKSGQNELGWVLVGADPVFNDQDEITEVVVTFIDISGLKKAEETLQAKMLQSQSLLRLSKRLESAQNFAEAVNAAVTEVRNLIGYPSLWVYLLSEDKKYFRALTASGSVADSVMSESIAATLTIEGDRMLEEIAASEQIVVVEDARMDERTNKDIVKLMGNRTIVNVPVILYDRHLGSVGTGTFGDEGVRVPNPSEQEYLLALASHMAVALDRIHLLSEREKAEQSVRHQKAMLEGVVNSTSSAVFSIDRDYRYTSFNRAHAEIMQTIYGANIEIGANMLDCMSNSDDRTLAKANLDRSLRGEQFMSTAESGEAQLTRRYYEVTHNPVFDNDGSCTGVAVFAMDVTERRRAEEQIEHLASFPRLNPIGIIEFSPSKDVLFANVSVQHLMAELNVSEPSQLIPEAWSIRLQTTAWDSQEVGVEEMTRGGRTIEETIFLVPESHSLRIYASEITARKRSEAEIARMNRVLQMLSDSNQALIRATDEASLLNEICRIAVEVGNYRMLWIGFAEDDENKSVRPVAYAGFDAGYLDSANITWADAERGRGPTGLSIRSGIICLARNIPEDPAYIPWKEAAIKRGYQSSIALPLTSDGKTFGTLSIYSDRVDAFDEAEIGILMELAGNLAFGITALRIRAENKKAEEERILHLHFLESMDLVNKALQGTGDLDQLMRDVLDTILSVFDCDRAWLVYPCDPDAPSWSVPMERTKPEYPGASILNLVIPMDADIAQVFSTIMSSSSPVRFGPGSTYPLPIMPKERFAVLSQIAVAIYPKGDKPYVLGLHQCSHARVWTPEDERLFQEIGRRFGDALSTMLAHHNVQRSEERYRVLFENSPISIWEEDFSAVQTIFSQLRDAGVDDLESYLEENPAIVKQCAIAVRVLDVNRATVTMHGAHSKDEVFRGLSQIFTLESYHTFQRELVALWNCHTEFVDEAEIQTLNGDRRQIMLDLSVCPGHELTLSRVLITQIDITERKQSEIELAKMNRALRMLSNSNQALIRLTDEKALLEEICRIVVETGGYRLAWIALAEQDEAKTLRPVAHAGFDSDYVKAAKLSWAEDSERGRGPGGIAVRTEKPYIARDITRDPTFAPWRDDALKRGYHSVIAIPLLGEGRAFGVFGIYAHETDAFDAEEVSILEEMSNDLAFGINALRTREERDRFVDALRQSQCKLQFHLEQTMFAVIEWGAEFKVRYWNPAAERIFGYTKDEAMGQTAPDLIVPKEIHSDIDAIWNQLLRQTGGTHYINDNLTKDGRTIICEWINTPLTDENGHVTGVMSFANDITDRRRAESALLESEQKYKQIFENVLDGLYLLEVTEDGRFRTIDVNPMLEQITGVPRSFSVGKTQEEIVPEEIARIVNEKYRRCVTAGQVVEEEAELDLPSGQRIFHSTLVPTRDDSGRIYRIIGISRDITESKKAERTILALNEQLELRVRDRTADLEIANKELESFAYSVSHDLRAPLRHIDGFLELLQKQTGDTLDPQSTHYMTTISRAAKRMGALIDDLLSFSRMGRHELAKSRVDLRTLVKDVLHEFEPDLAGRSVHWEISDSLPVVTGDQAMLRMVFVNLLANALKFTRTREEATIEIGIVPDRLPETVVYVRDNGVGFDMHYSQKLFGVFQRLHREDEFEGTGIGLANVQRIIHRHGGNTWAESQVDHGATFYFSLPNAE